ncbi:MAG: ACP phosphodiesterase [Bacteroidales bacterium]|nr:ACP phosphodiesterase [Bacteroidales bacterium]
MNYLAHLYLSQHSEEMMVGGVLADFIKGNKKNINPKILKGIELHRKIDKFIDEHPVIEESKKRLRKKFSHYTPVIIDIYCDHFLAVNWKNYSEETLESFAERSYKILKKYRFLFPLRFQHALIYGRFKNLLLSYSTFEGIDFAFQRLRGRTKFHSNLNEATEELKKNYDLYQNEFEIFFRDIVGYLKKCL